MKNKLNNKKMIIIGIVLLLILGIGFSYAWWRYTVIQDNPNTAMSKCLSIELSNQANEINLTNMYPISDEEGRKLTPFTFTLTNTCTMSAKYTLNLEMLEGTTLNSKYLAVLVNKGNIKLLSDYDTAKTVIDGSTESRTLDTGVLQAKGSKDYSIALWLDKSVTLADDAQNKVFKSKVVVDAVATETPVDKIIASVDTTGKCPTINSDGTVNVTDIEATDGYICSAEDAYGTSYYYRGNVANNYVKFADKYWRIIRINGDGSVRVIYDGTSAHVNGESSSDRQIGTSEFNYYWKKDKKTTNSYVGGDNAGVGYMYGNADTIVEPTTYYSSNNFTNTSSYYVAKEYTFDESTRLFTLKDPIQVLGSDLTTDYVGYYYTSYTPTSTPSSAYSLYKIIGITTGDSSTSVKYGFVRYGTSSKEVSQTNTNDSTIKTYLDNWYKNNILGTENEQYLADNIFCNDRGFASSNSGTGAGQSYTNYTWSTDNSRRANLKCQQQNDAFTVDDTVYGNGALTYPIGLITADETVLAGGSAVNKNYYLYTGSNFYTFSPRNFSNYATMLVVSSDGYGGGNGSSTASFNGVRPVLNLSQEVLKNGDGSMNNPYHP